MQLSRESGADGTGFILVGNSMHMACRDRNHDRERGGGNRQDEPREEKTMVLAGQVKHARTAHRSYAWLRRNGQAKKVFAHAI